MSRCSRPRGELIGRAGVKNNLTPSCAPSSQAARNHQNQTGLSALRRIIAGAGSGRDEEDASLLLLRRIRSEAGEHCRIGWADREDVVQTVLCDMHHRLTCDEGLKSRVAGHCTDRELMRALRARIRLRLRSRTVDAIRRISVRLEVPLEDTPQENSPPQIPDREEVLTALRTSPRLKTSYAADLRYLLHMVENTASARQTARAHVVNPSTVDRAVKRTRPLLRAEFGLDG